MASMEEGNSIIQDEEISKAYVDFFQGSYGSYDSHHKLDNLEFSMIGKETVDWMEHKMDKLEVKGATFEVDYWALAPWAR